ncbi:MAG: YbaB/EbfC family nucleoid-associated protein [Erysipelotrichaceae bacterium]|nr:YbaB/EbfC family nucleoid-associated protein [Erysipelotrichaceae bacterium]MDY6035134.1 YbaB/EbfC family nucleoid-associated protein [Bulleidia sp.]
MDIQKLMEQARQMQNNLGKIEDELNQTEYEGKAGGNGVKVVINGKNEVQSVEIADDLMSLDNKEMLQDLLLIAVNEAVDKAYQDREEKLGSATNGLNLPGM